MRYSNVQLKFSVLIDVVSTAASPECSPYDDDKDENKRKLQQIIQLERK